MRLVLMPLAAVYEVIVRIRNFLYDSDLRASYVSSLPVVSIGNLTAGGNGKTPLCMFVVSQLVARGYRPVVLSRGYGGSEVGPRVVVSTDSPGLVGDEPLLMCRSGIDVVVCRKRALGAQFIERMGLFDVIVLDDGLQHRALSREIDIASVFVGTEKACHEFEEGRLLPLGLFREPRDRALTRVDAVVLNVRRVYTDDDDLVSQSKGVRKVLPNDVSVYYSGLVDPRVQWLRSAEGIQPCEVALFTAIANPAGVVQSLESMGFVVRASLEFSDHHVFSEDQIRDFANKHADVPIVCTEKDAVKTGAFSADLVDRLAVLCVTATVNPVDDFISQIEDAISFKVRDIRGG